MQKDQSVAYVYRALNAAEINYAQIEKEMLEIVYGLLKFNEYVYDKTVSVETDHKPLEGLLKQETDWPHCSPEKQFKSRQM